MPDPRSAQGATDQPTAPLPGQRRRVALGGAVALAAAAAGFWLAQRRQTPEALAAGDAAVPEALWTTPMPRAAGAGQIILAEFRGQPLLLNFWATWCPPCVQEMPELAAFAKAQGNQGWQVLGLAIDERNAVADFLLRLPQPYTLALAPPQAMEWMRALGNPAAGLPFTVALDRAGTVVMRQLGATTAAGLTERLPKP